MKIEFIRVILRSTSPVFISAPETVDFSRAQEAHRSDLDLPLRRGLDGMPVVPATAVAGSIRAHLPEPLQPELMGFVSSEESSRSPLSVLGVEVRSPDNGEPVTTFHRTAINRWSGAAAVGKLFDGEGLAEGTSLVVRMALLDAREGLVESLLDSLSTWAPRLGRGVSAGAGRLEIDRIEAGGLDLSVMADLLLYLNGGGPTLVDAVVSSRDGRRIDPITQTPELLLDEEMEVVDALHVGGGKASSGNVQRWFRNARDVPTIPGTTIKGILRSRVEYILRSLEVEVCTDGSDGSCPSCQLFGYTLAAPDAEGRTGRRGRLAFFDATVSDAEVTTRDHVAIDRVTGGARDQALFATEVVTQGAFRIRVEAIEPVPTWARGLLLAALVDVDEGYVGIGGGTTRGQGTVRRVGGPLRERYGTDIDEAILAVTSSGEGQ